MSKPWVKQLTGRKHIGGHAYHSVALFRYWTEDPLAVSFRFWDAKQLWFSRDLLAAGLRQPVGEELFIWSDGHVVEFVLPNPDGAPGTSYVFKHDDLQHCLTQTYALVPLGTEHVDITEFLTTLGVKP